MTYLSDLGDEVQALSQEVAPATVTYTTVGATNTTASVTVLAFEQQYAITDDKENKKFVVRSSDVSSPEREDRITEADGTEWVILDVQSRCGGSFFLLFGIRAQDRS